MPRYTPHRPIFNKRILHGTIRTGSQVGEQVTRVNLTTITLPVSVPAPTVTVPIDPSSVGDMEVWYDAADTGTLGGAGLPSVATIDDKSGNNRTGLVNNDDYTTGAMTQNGLNVLQSGGNQPYLDIDGTALPLGTSKAVTLFIVATDTFGLVQEGRFACTPITNQDHQGIVVTRNSDTQLGIEIGDGAALVGASDVHQYFYTVNETTSFRLITVRVSTSAVQLRINGVTQSVASEANSMNIANFWASGTAPIVQFVGRREHSLGQRAWDAHFAEFILYSASLSDGDRDAVEDYLLDKWGL